MEVARLKTPVNALELAGFKARVNGLISSIPKSMELPVVTPHLQKLLFTDDPDRLHDDLHNVVRSDPVILARLVQLANSADYGLAGRYFYTALECIMRIGLVTSRDFALGI